MSGSVTVDTLRTRIRQRADQEHTGSTFVTDAELLGLIQSSYDQLYGHLVRSGFQMAEITYTLPVNGAATYDLPADFFSLLGVFRVDSGHSIRLPRHDVRHRANTTERGDAVSYRLTGSDIALSPRPGSGTYEVVYVPIPGTLSAGSDTVDGVLGWEEYIVLDVAARIYEKEESDSSQFRRQQDIILERIKDEAAAAEMTESWCVAVTDGDAYGPDPAGEYTRRGYRGPLTGYRRW